MTGKSRWIVCALLFVVTVISYIDRQAFGLVAPVLAREFSFTNEQIAVMAGAFLLAYAFLQIASGKLIDHVGDRSGFALAVLLWSLAQGATAMATGIGAFTVCRFLLGLGESGNFPGGVKVLARWFPSRDRAFAVGVFSSGGSVGAVIAPPLVAFITHYFGWRPVFLFTGALGFVWLAAWLWFYRVPPADVERDAASAEPSAQTMARWTDLIRCRPIVAVAAARFFEEPTIWFYLTWLPKYLVEHRHFDLLKMGMSLTIPYLTLDFGYVAGGWLSSRLIQRGVAVTTARRRVMLGSCALMMCSVPAAFTQSTTLFFVFVSAATMAHGLWTASAVTLPSDLAPQRLSASAYGITAVGGGAGGLLFMQITGFVVDKTGSFNSLFVAIGLLPVIAAAIVHFQVRPAAAPAAEAVGRA